MLAGLGLSPATPSDVVDARATVVALTDNLQRCRLLRSTRSTQDRRAYALYLTETGRLLVTKAHTLMDRCDRDLMAPLPAGTKAELAGVLRSLLAAATPGEERMTEV